MKTPAAHGDPRLQQKPESPKFRVSSGRGAGFRGADRTSRPALRRFIHLTFAFLIDRNRAIGYSGIFPDRGMEIGDNAGGGVPRCGLVPARRKRELWPK